jgi:hypothetical protein
VEQFCELGCGEFAIGGRQHRNHPRKRADIGQPKVARVVAGVQSVLHGRGYLLVLELFDCASAWNTIAVQLQQRGIEGVIAIDAILPPEQPLPVASVDLESMPLLEALADDRQTQLAELGESAAETVLRQIEKENVLRRMKVVPQRPGGYFDLANTRLAAEGNARERA